MILVIGDQHIQTNNIPMIDLFIMKLKAHMLETVPEYCIFLGDMLHHHEKLNTFCLNKSSELINMARNICPTYILVGNHDMVHQVQFLTDKHWLNPYKEWDNVTIVDTVIVTDMNGFKVTLVPYVEPGRFEEALDTSGNAWKDSSVIFAHQEFHGCKMGAITSIVGDMWPDENPSVISGHIHDNQTIGSNIYYPGSALQHSFSDSRKKIIGNIDLSICGYTCNEIDLELPKKTHIQIDIADINIDKIDTIDENDSVKLSLSGNVQEFKSFQKSEKCRQLKKKGVKSAFKPKKLAVSEYNKFIDTSKTELRDKGINAILKCLIDNRNDPSLLKLYDTLVTQQE